MDWFLHDKDLRRERVKRFVKVNSSYDDDVIDNIQISPNLICFSYLS